MRYEYQIIVQQLDAYEDNPIMAIMDLEDRINSWAKYGWRCINSYYSPSEPGYIAVLERRVFA